MEQIKYKAGDVLVGCKGDERTVLAVLGAVAVLSEWDDPSIVGGLRTQHELDKAGLAPKDQNAEPIDALKAGE